MNARNSFDKELERLHMDLIKMGSMAEEAIEQSVRAFSLRDNALAKEVMQGDHQIDDMEKQIETVCLSLILRQQPVAGDLRRITCALKMITDLERIADNAADIAELSLMIQGDHITEMVRHIPNMAKESVEMVHKSIDSFVRSDLALAEQVIAQDDIVDALFCKVKDELCETLRQNRDNSDNAIDFLMIAKYLERIADHAVNICEWVLFSETGIHKDKKIM
ncbi:MAG: phosphate signaling complex protein PhoU [Clostridiales bacterium]|nr:phosphate signaling complex protein PhoU [Clostridiales bacterium]